MRGVVLLACLIGATFVGGCASYRLEQPAQLFQSQTYLPLPREYKPDPDVADKFASLGRADSSCADPQIMWRDPTGGSRKTFQLLPGMTIRVVETTYRRNEASGFPVVSEWQWTLPRSGKCGDDLDWGRDDLLKVRHLLSGATIKSTEATPDVDYYLQAVRWAGCQPAAAGLKEKECSFSLVRTQFLDPFLASLEINYRDSGLNFRQDGPTAPISVTTTPFVGTELASWFGAVNAVRSADFFRFPTTGDTASMDLAQLCSKLTQRRVAAPVYLDGPRPDAARKPDTRRDGHGFSTVDLAACNFTLKRLSLIQPDRWTFAGGSLLPGSELVLLTSGDPLLLFRPPAQANVLDSSGRRLCPPATPGNPSQICNEDQRLGQGFVDFDVLFNVNVTGDPKPRLVSSNLTIEQFERLHGASRKVLTLKRNTVWIPKVLRAIKVGVNSESAVELDAAQFAEGRFVEFEFGDAGGGGWHGTRALVIKNSLKDQILLAPGDVITLSR